eukprot:118305_1
MASSPSTNYDKCIGALQWNYDYKHEYINMFKNWYKEDEFEDEQLIEEFVEEENGYDESFFIEYLRQEFANFDDTGGQKLFNHLRNGLSNHNDSPMNPHSDHFRTFDSKNKAQFLISFYIEEQCYSHIVPMEIIELCAIYFGPLLWPWFFQKATSNHFVDSNSLEMVTSHSNDVAKALHTRQCSKIPITNEILALHVIGVYNNQFPLLTYLIDAYNRFRVETSIKVQQRPKLRAKNRHRVIKDLCVNVFIKKVCEQGFKALGLGKSQTRSLQNICIEAIEYLTNWRHLGKALIKTDDSIYVIKHSIKNYQLFVSECFAAVRRYIDDNERMPCQIDVTILPHKMHQRGIAEESDSDTDNAWDDDHMLDDLHYLLRCNNIPYVNIDIQYDNCSTAILDAIEQILDSEINQRCCIVFDARCKTLFVYQPPTSSTASTFEPYNDRFVHESLFDNSVKYMIPGFSSIGIKEEHLFSISFHCMDSNEVQAYLFIEEVCTRFAISDFEVYLAKFNNMFKDNRFDAFYNRMVNRNYEVRSRDERVNVIVKVPWRFDVFYPPSCKQYIKKKCTVFERAKDEDRYDHDDAQIQQYILSSQLTDFQFKKGHKYLFKIKCERHTSLRFVEEVQTIAGVEFGIEDADCSLEVKCEYALQVTHSEIIQPRAKEVKIVQDGSLQILNVSKYRNVRMKQDGTITDWSRLDAHQQPLRYETRGEWKYGDVLMMEIDCTDCTRHQSCYLSYFVNYKRIHTPLKIKEFYRRRYYPFIRSRRDNIRFEIVLP